MRSALRRKLDAFDQIHELFSFEMPKHFFKRGAHRPAQILYTAFGSILERPSAGTPTPSLKLAVPSVSLDLSPIFSIFPTQKRRSP